MKPLPPLCKGSGRRPGIRPKVCGLGREYRCLLIPGHGLRHGSQDWGHRVESGHPQMEVRGHGLQVLRR